MTKRLLNDINDDDIIDINDFQDISDTENDVNEQINAAYAEFGDEKDVSVYYKIYANVKNSKKKDWLFDCTKSDFPIMELLRDRYGTGTYVARMYVGDAMKRAFEMNIRSPLFDQNIVKKEENNTSDLARAMADGFVQLGELISRNNNPQQINPMELQSNFLAQMVAMKDFLSGDKPESPLKMLKEVMQIKELISEPDKESSANDVLLGLLNTFGKPIADMSLKQHQLSQQKPKQNPIKQKQSVQKARPKNSGVEQMKMQLMFLCSMAAKGADVETYANMVLDQTSEEKLSDLIEFISQENAVEQMGKIYQPVLQYPDWFKTLGDTILELTEIEEENLTNKPESTIDINNADIEPKQKIDTDVNPKRTQGDANNSKNNEKISESGKKDIINQRSGVKTS